MQSELPLTYIDDGGQRPDVPLSPKDVEQRINEIDEVVLKVEPKQPSIKPEIPIPEKVDSRPQTPIEI